MTYTAYLNGQPVASNIAYAPLEIMYKGTAAVIQNDDHPAEAGWWADDQCLAAQAEQLINQGYGPDLLVHRLAYYDGEEWINTGLSSPIAGVPVGGVETYRSLAQVIEGCWD